MDGPVEDPMRTGKLSHLLPGPCAKAVLAVFGSFFLIALLSVPVTTTTSRLQQDEGSNIVVRTTYPRNSTMFLPLYLARKTKPPEGTTIHARQTPWFALMAIVLVLGISDYIVFCRLLRRRRQPVEEPEPGGEFKFP
jgi:hypothetical protein